MKKIISHFFTLLFFFHTASAQYRGGVDDGQAYKFISNQNATPDIFRGGFNDGFSSVISVNQNPLPGIYVGGANDGFNMASAIFQNSIPGIYFGGRNDGIATAHINNQNASPGIYVGGTNDGFSSELFKFQNPGASIYLGGSNDGWASSLTNLQNALPGIYFGGANDGWATVIVYKQNSTVLVPLKILAFNGKWITNDAFLNWQINGSLEIEKMEVERSTDGGRQFTKIANVTPQATDFTENYNYTDISAWNLPSNFLLYRLKFAGITGRIAYSTVVKLNKDKSAAIMAAYPNPTSGKLTLSIQNVSDFTDYGYQVYSMDGKLVQHGNINSGSTYLDLQRSAAGTYNLIVFKKGSIIQKFKIILTL